MATEIPKNHLLEETVFAVKYYATFTQVALRVFRFQYEHNTIYRQFCQAIGKNPQQIVSLTDIPFLPISFFKTHAVCTTSFTPQVTFESSGTTGALTSRHYVKDIHIYEESFLRTFEQFYGKADDYCILGLLPSYLERSHSSLVYMVDKLIQLSGHPSSNFYLYDFKQLAATIKALEAQRQKTILMGVTYALLDFAAQYPMPLEHTIIMETGGMKGRKKEMIRSDVHEQLKQAFGINPIHSEYGMTELLSQAYAHTAGRFYTPPWMKILLREEDDPLHITSPTDKPITGAINIIDLANLYSCSFVATEDIGRLYGDGSFEVLGRMDNTDIRGCSLLAV